MLNQIVNKIARQLENAEIGLFVEYKPGYFAYVNPSDEGGYGISYHKGEMPAFESESFDTADEAAAEMVKVGMEWREIESDEE